MLDKVLRPFRHSFIQIFSLLLLFSRDIITIAAARFFCDVSIVYGRVQWNTNMRPLSKPLENCGSLSEKKIEGVVSVSITAERE